ncbi:hypothetical protein METBIDRAFT_228140 [Metschnikowia bicuspidata var. bicuspidata NRRL YB-4993]|uniref:Uncharacterized protein n=1 Tax=Metschnikowia bicuspidata var. bicuspidata NRRL YB-4993 TaxID=869754 RepID=A0A1A0HF54_9ASCO|nr:hypothetical protein METBIDRAFT_228140 [Metschnikowia bicuspidata var. bicuspidata NRRL YB-4993]OBA22764.1 hypothetical protein METBIDRAFT_228140 [Metschnikowia bicuspidata var. bicuspidata NRRL YB-4993]
MVPLQVNFTGREEESDFPYSGNLTHTLGLNFKELAFSLGQLSMVFLVDLFRFKNHKTLDHLPLLLRISFSLMDQYFPLVQEQTVSLLMHTMHSIAPDHPKAKRFVETLRKRDDLTRLWTYDLNNDKKGALLQRI